MADTCLSREVLEALLEDRLIDPEHHSASRHFRECSACQAAADSIIAQLSVSEFLSEPRRDQPSEIREVLQQLRSRLNADIANVKQATADASPGGVAGGARYRMLRPHASGGIGEVFIAFDEELSREVALKAIKAEHVDNSALRGRFLQEAEVTGRLEHPGIVPIYSLGNQQAGRPYYAMRFIRGESLEDAIRRFHFGGDPTSAHNQASLLDATSSPDPSCIASKQRTTPSLPAAQRAPASAFSTVEFRKLLGRFINACQAIEYAHSRQVLHRDLKPSNIMVGPFGETLIVDWGLAKVMGVETTIEGTDAPGAASKNGGLDETLEGSVLGTPAYMSPEQASGFIEQLSPSSDVYSLGATLYHLLTGVRPFQASYPLVLEHVRQGAFPPPRKTRPEVPPPLEAICLKAMALQPNQRYSSANEIAEDLEHWLADEPVAVHAEGLIEYTSRWSRKHRAWAMSGTAALALVALTALVYTYRITHQNTIISQQKEAATRLADSNARLAHAMSTLAEKEAAARSKADTNATVAARHLYAAHMNIIQSAWESNQFGEVRRLLGLHDPDSKECVDPADLRGFEWYYWYRRSHSELRALSINEGSPVNLVYSSEGRYLATSTDSCSVIVWDRQSWKQIAQLHYRQQEQKQAIRSHARIAFSPDGNSVLAVDRDMILRCWSIATLQSVLEIDLDERRIERLGFNKNGSTLAGLVGGQVMRWDLSNGSEMPPVEWDRDDHVYSFTREWDHLIARLYIAATAPTNTEGEIPLQPKQRKSAAPPSGYTYTRTDDAVYSADGSLRARKGSEAILIEDGVTGAEVVRLSSDGHPVLVLTFGPQKDRIAAGCSDGAVVEWDLSTRALRNVFKGSDDQWWSIAYSADNTEIAVAGWKRGVKIWDTTRAEIRRDHVAIACRSSSTISGGKIMAYADDQSIGSIDLDTAEYTPIAQRREWDVQPFNSATYPIALSRTGRIAHKISEREISVVDLDGGPLGRITVSGRLASCALSSDGMVLWASTTSGHVLSWTLKDGIQERSSIKRRKNCRFVASRDGTYVYIWGGQEPPCIYGPGGSLELSEGTGWWGMDFSLDNKLLAVGGDSNSVLIVDVATGRVNTVLRGMLDGLCRFGFLPQRDRVATCHRDTACIWDLETGSKLLTIKECTSSGILEFDGAGQRMVAQNLKGHVKIIDARVTDRGADERNRNSRIIDAAIARNTVPSLTVEQIKARLGQDRFLSIHSRQEAIERVAKQYCCQGAEKELKRGKWGSQKLLYVRCNGTIGIVHGVDSKDADVSPVIWVDTPIIKTRAKDVFAICKGWLVEVKSGQSPELVELRRFDASVADFAVHPFENKIAWVREGQQGGPDVILSRFDGSHGMYLGRGYDPAWSLDGRNLVYASNSSEEGWHLVVRNDAGSKKIRVKVHPSVHLFPSPTSTGQQIAYSMLARDQSLQIGLVSLDGMSRQLTSTGQWNTRAAFSPDDRYVAFLRGYGSEAKLIVIDVESGEESVVADDAEAVRPVWLE